jgi:uncharacterized membrane protein
MSWGLMFRIRQALKGSLWVLPLVGGLLGIVLSNASVWLEGRAFVPHGWDYSADTAQTVLTTVVGATVGLTGFVVTVTILVVQMATGTFSARYMRLWYRDPVLKATLAVLVGALAFSFSLLRRIDENVPSLGVTMSGFLLGAGLVLFLVFLDRCLHRLRPVKVASLVAHTGREALRKTVDLATTRRRSGADAELDELLAGTPTLVVRSSTSGAIQAIDDEGLLAWATANDGVIVIRHGVGDFVSANAVILEVHGTASFPRIAERRLSGRIALGTERTIEQDPAFALRILVDIAIRALSPAVNDPTTAGQVINHIEDTMALIGATPGLDGRWEYRDEAGGLRLVMPAHRFDDLVALAFTEIREYGHSSIQVVRRLRSALLELQSSVLPEYVSAIAAELERLDLTSAATFGGTPDAAYASQADRQGVGGPPQLAARP